MRARSALREAVLGWEGDHLDLTDVELLAVVSGVLGEQLGDTVKAMLRAERHPDDPDKPAGIE
jgi:hypothetical protein